MPKPRTIWLLRVTVACLAIVSALFVAHLGAEGHSDECHACEIAAHAAAIEAPTTIVDITPVETPAERPAGSTVPVSTIRAPGAPRAPPTA